MTTENLIQLNELEKKVISYWSNHVKELELMNHVTIFHDCGNGVVGRCDCGTPINSFEIIDNSEFECEFCNNKVKDINNLTWFNDKLYWLTGSFTEEIPKNFWVDDLKELKELYFKREQK